MPNKKMFVAYSTSGTTVACRGHDHDRFVSTAPPDPALPTVKSVLQCHVPQLWPAGSRLSPNQAKVLRKLTLCRQAPLGTHAWHCRWCGNIEVSYNGCHNRHCTDCRRYRRVAWVERILEWSLPIDYLHCVFTLPHEFIPWILANDNVMYRLLFDAVAETLSQLARELHGVRLGFVMVLHSWGQRMNAHPHLHIIVTCGGLSWDESHWVPLTKEDAGFSEATLASRFRQQFLEGLRRRFRQQKLTAPRAASAVTDEAALEVWLQPVLAKNWRVHVQAAPPEYRGPTAVLNYLAGYVVGTAIRDERILRHDGRCVVIRVKNYRTGQQEELPLTGVQFVERFALHILPQGLQRVRFVGLFSPNLRRQKLEICRQLLGVDSPVPDREARDGEQDAEKLPAELPTDEKHIAGEREPPPASLFYGLPECLRCGMPGMRMEGVRMARQSSLFLLRLRYACNLMFTWVSTFEFGAGRDPTASPQWIVAASLDTALLLDGLVGSSFTTPIATFDGIPLPDT